MTRRVSVDRIKSEVAADYGVPILEMESHRRDRQFLIPRHVAIYLACTMTPLSRSVIGRLFGNRDHSTIWHAHRSIEAERKADIFLDGRLRRLERQLAPPEPKQEVQLAMFDGPLFDCLPQELAA